MPTPGIVAPVSRLLAVSDTARSIGFYRDILGFDVREGDGPAANACLGPALIELRKGDETIESTGSAARAGRRSCSWRPTTLRACGRPSSAGVAGPASWRRSTGSRCACSSCRIGSRYVYIRYADALHAELKARGANLQGEPVSHPWGPRDFQVLDLEGNRITFGQPFE